MSDAVSEATSELDLSCKDVQESFRSIESRQGKLNMQESSREQESSTSIESRHGNVKGAWETPLGESETPSDALSSLRGSRTLSMSRADHDSPHDLPSTAAADTSHQGESRTSAGAQVNSVQQLEIPSGQTASISGSHPPMKLGVRVPDITLTHSLKKLSALDRDTALAHLPKRSSALHQDVALTRLQKSPGALEEDTAGQCTSIAESREITTIQSLREAPGPFWTGILLIM